MIFFEQIEKFYDLNYMNINRWFYVSSVSKAIFEKKLLKCINKK